MSMTVALSDSIPPVSSQSLSDSGNQSPSSHILQPIPQEADSNQPDSLLEEKFLTSEKDTMISVEDIATDQVTDDSYFSESSEDEPDVQRSPSPTPSEIHIRLTQIYGIKVRDFAQRPVVTTPVSIEETYQKYLNLRYAKEGEDMKRSPSPAAKLWKGFCSMLASSGN